MPTSVWCLALMSIGLFRTIESQDRGILKIKFISLLLKFRLTFQAKHEFIYVILDKEFCSAQMSKTLLKLAGINVAYTLLIDVVIHYNRAQKYILSLLIFLPQLILVCWEIFVSYKPTQMN